MATRNFRTTLTVTKRHHYYPRNSKVSQQVVWHDGPRAACSTCRRASVISGNRPGHVLQYRSR
jgi:hypothetical protein